MREIKFRIWDNDNKYMGFIDFNDLTKLSGIISSYEDYFSRNYFSEPDEETGFPLLMQYIGLKDKNGVEIYEGDMVMQWDEVVYIEDLQGAHYMMTECTLDDTCEIISNIYTPLPEF